MMSLDKENNEMEIQDFPIKTDLSANEREKSKIVSYFGMWLAIFFSSSFEILGAFIGTIVLMIAVSMNFILIQEDGSYDPNTAQAQITLLIVNVLAISLIGGLFFIVNRKMTTTNLKQDIRITKREIKLIIYSLSSMFFLVAGLEALISYIQNSYFPDFLVETPYDFFASDNLLVIIIALISVSIFSPIAEEIFYRWTIIETFRKGMNKYATIIFSALVFAFAHSGANLSYSFYFFIIHFVTTFIIGLIFGFVYYETRKVFITIILHALWNFIISISALFEFYNIGEIFYIVYLVLIGLGAIITIIGLSIFLSKKENRKEIRKNVKIDKTKIKLRAEWFILILVYFFTIVILPILILEITEFFQFGESFIIIVYLALLMILSAFLASRNYHKYNYYFNPIKQENNLDIQLE